MAEPVDAGANAYAYVTGSTFSSNFLTASALQGSGDGSDAFVTELNATGSALVYSTYLGGSGGDRGWGIAVEGANAYVAGSTFSNNFPTANPSHPANAGLGDGFIAKLDPASSPPFTPTPPSVGGIAELPEVAGSSLEEAGSPGTRASLLAGTAGAIAVIGIIRRRSRVAAPDGRRGGIDVPPRPARRAQQAAGIVGTLKVVEGPNAGASIELGDGAVEIGSSATCGLKLDESGGTVGGTHARVWLQGGRLMLHHLARQGQTFVGDKAVEWATLDPRDSLRIGPHLIAFAIDSSRTPDSA